MASTGLNEESVEKKLMSVTNTQDSIQSLSLWIIHHKNHYAYIVELWYRVMKKSAKPSHRLTLFYLCNDVVQTCKRKKAQVFVNAFKPLLKNATALVRDATIRPKVERIFCVWEERQVFEKDFVTELRAILDGKQADGAVFKKPFSPTPREKLKERAKQKSKEKKKEAPPTSSTAEDSSAGKDNDAAVTADKEEVKKEDEVPSEETLATFKPTELIQKMQTFKKQTSEVKNSVQKLSHLKLDASSIEAVKQLKDRAHGNEFSNDFEESCLRLDETAEGLEKLKQEQKDLLAQLHIAEHFYSQQHSEARIVANAYKTYGSRINLLSKKLGEMLKTLPSSVKSPPPAQSVSPGNTPPSELYEPMDYQLGGSDDSHTGSPNGDAVVSPSISGKVSYTQASGVDQLEKRLNSFIPSLQSMGSSSSISDEEHPIPVYIPQPTMSNGSTSSRRPSANRTLTDAEDPFPSEEGGSTPLTDEPPTTPVMDEEPESSPSPPPPPPPPPVEKHKENPIDFLSRLISQSQKNSTPTSTGVNNSFLANFTKLTSQMKQSVPRTPGRGEKEEKEDGTGGGSPRPRCWAEWKKEKAVEMSSRVEQPDTSLPPPLIPGFPPTSSALAPLGVPPPPPLPVPSLPMLSAPSLPPLTIPPPPGSQPSLTPLMVPPPPVSPITNPSLSSPSSLPPGMHHAPPGSLASMPPLSSPSSLVTRISPVAVPSVPPPISPSSISPRALSVVSSQPVPSPSLSMPTSSFFEHTSPGQKENWPEAGEGMEDSEDMMPSPGMEYSVDMPFPPVGLRMRSNSSVLKELTPSTEEMSVSEASSILSPPPSSESDGKLTQACEEEVSAIATLSSSPGRGGQGYMDKLKTKGSRGYLPSTYVHNPNLTTLTPGGDGDEDEEEEEDEDEEEEEEEEEENGATRIPVLSSVVRRVDPREKRQDREKDRHSFRDRDSKYPHSSSKHRGETFRRDRHYNRESDQDDYFASGYNYRDGRSYDFDSVHPTSDYPPCPENPYDNRGYDSYPYGQSSTSRQLHKYGISQGSSHRSYRH